MLADLIKKNPDHPENDLLYLLIGKALTKQGHVKKSYRLFNTLIKKYPKSDNLADMKSALLEAKNKLKNKNKLTTSSN